MYVKKSLRHSITRNFFALVLRKINITLDDKIHFCGICIVMKYLCCLSKKNENLKRIFIKTPAFKYLGETFQHLLIDAKSLSFLDVWMLFQWLKWIVFYNFYRNYTTPIKLTFLTYFSVLMNVFNLSTYRKCTFRSCHGTNVKTSSTRRRTTSRTTWSVPATSTRRQTRAKGTPGHPWCASSSRGSSSWRDWSPGATGVPSRSTRGSTLRCQWSPRGFRTSCPLQRKIRVREIL